MPPGVYPRKHVHKTCIICGHQFRTKVSHFAKRKTCSRGCLAELKRVQMSGEGNHQYGLRGEKNDSWKGGTHHNGYGYTKVYSPGHPRAVDGYVLQHRLVMESILGRLLSEDEIVHHKDGNRSNNSPDNLELMTLSEHSAMHNVLSPMPRDSETGRFVSKKGMPNMISVQEPEETSRGVNGFGSTGT